jgi:hypothetical protein
MRGNCGSRGVNQDRQARPAKLVEWAAELHDELSFASFRHGPLPRPETRN